MKIATIIGARPQFIKASMISMEIPKPDYNLNIHSLSHGAMTGRQLEEIEKVLIKDKPDFVVVYGDTNSTLAGALASTKLNIPLAHIEAGLRSFNRKMPEEINRILSDSISSLLFCPTLTAIENLHNEGITEGVYNVGDVMYDAVLRFSQVAENKPELFEHIDIKQQKYILATVHRQENTDNLESLTNIFSTFAELPFPIIIPMHPRTKKRLLENKINFGSNILSIDPVGYLEMISLIKNCKFLMTDSGGLQKEAYFLKKPCITLREETEWVETIKSGWNILVGSNPKKIVKAITNITIPDNHFNYYGDGNSGEVILNHIINY